jgi:hypothetical protein
VSGSADPIPEPVLALDREVLRTVKELHRLELALGGLLRDIESAGGMRALAFANLGAYAEVRGIGPVARAFQLKRLAGALPALPIVREAYLEARLGPEKTAALTHVAAGEEERWVEGAVRMTTAEVQAAVREERVRRRELPPSERRVIDAHRDDWRSFDDAVVEVQRALGRVVSKGEALGVVSRAYVENREVRRRGLSRGGPGREDIDPRTLPEGLPGARWVARAVAEAVWKRDKGRCRVPGCCFPAFLQLAHIVEVKNGGKPSYLNLLLLCQAHNMLHELGFLFIEGDAENPLFLHADRRPFGAPPPAPS